MTGHTVASARWRALDCEGDDSCRLCRTDHGWMLVGHARFRAKDTGFSALDYVVRCDTGWQTISADIAGMQEGLEVNLRVVKENDTWLLNDVVQLGVNGATDLDLSFTPATNLMPLRRLMASGEASEITRAAWLRYPRADLQTLDQTYGRTGHAGTYSYKAKQTGYATRLRADDIGFVTSYPDLWEGMVTFAD